MAAGRHGGHRKEQREMHESCLLVDIVCVIEK
jgi:hypothetical protein